MMTYLEYARWVLELGQWQAWNQFTGVIMLWFQALYSFGILMGVQ